MKKLLLALSLILATAFTSAIGCNKTVDNDPSSSPSTSQSQSETGSQTGGGY